MDVEQKRLSPKKHAQNGHSEFGLFTHVYLHEFFITSTSRQPSRYAGVQVNSKIESTNTRNEARVRLSRGPKSHPKMLFSTKLYEGRYQELETFDRRKVRKNHLMDCRLAVQLFGVRLRGPEYACCRIDGMSISLTVMQAA
jgi:hypothetical protein